MTPQQSAPAPAGLSDHARQHVRRFLEGDLPPAHINLGIRPDLWVRTLDFGRVTLIWPNDGSRDIGSGRVFGGWIAALSDHVVSLAMATTLADGEAFTTQDLKIKMFRPVSAGEIRIEGLVRNRSKTTAYVEAEWLLPDGRLAAKALAWKAVRRIEVLDRAAPA